MLIPATVMPNSMSNGRAFGGVPRASSTWARRSQRRYVPFTQCGWLWQNWGDAEV